MTDQLRASALAREAYQLWNSGKLSDAELRYQEAIEWADPKHWGLPSYCSELACVLNAQGKSDRATLQFEKALSLELSHGENDGSLKVIVARYFLADQLIRNHDPSGALDVLTPSILASPTNWFIRLAEAKALFALDRLAEARRAADCAIQNAPSTIEREELLQDLSAILESD